MAQISKIQFQSVGRNEGCTCDKCGQYIRNIWIVDFADGVRVNFGIDCFAKMKKESNLSKFGEKELNKVLKSIKDYQKMFEAEKQLTEETDIRYWHEQEKHDWESPSYWYGKPWEEYHAWMINEWYPARFADCEKSIKRFSKVNFAR